MEQALTTRQLDCCLYYPGGENKALESARTALEEGRAGRPRNSAGDVLGLAKQGQAKTFTQVLSEKSQSARGPEVCDRTGVCLGSVPREPSPCPLYSLLTLYRDLLLGPPGKIWPCRHGLEGEKQCAGAAQTTSKAPDGFPPPQLETWPQIATSPRSLP